MLAISSASVIWLVGMGHPVAVRVVVVMIGVLALDDLHLAAESLHGRVDQFIGLGVDFLFEGVGVDADRAIREDLHANLIDGFQCRLLCEYGAVARGFGEDVLVPIHGVFPTLLGILSSFVGDDLLADRALDRVAIHLGAAGGLHVEAVVLV